MEIKDGILLKVTDDDIEENGIFTIPEGITEIRYCAFYDCRRLTGVVIPKSVKKIGKYAFKMCKNLTGVVIPDSVTEIGEFAFADCQKLTKITIPEGVKKISACAFGGCENLTSIVIPKTVEKIGAKAFCDCESLTSVVLPEGITEIKECAFEWCWKLESKPSNYKAFQIKNGKLYCLDKVYKEEKVNSVQGDLKMCRNGIHYCTNLFEIFNYYGGEIDKDIAIYEIEVGDKVLTSDYSSKCCTNSCVLKRRLYRKDIIKILNGKNK